MADQDMEAALARLAAAVEGRHETAALWVSLAAHLAESGVGYHELGNLAYHRNTAHLLEMQGAD